MGLPVQAIHKLFCRRHVISTRFAGVPYLLRIVAEPLSGRFEAQAKREPALSILIFFIQGVTPVFREPAKEVESLNW